MMAGKGTLSFNITHLAASGRRHIPVQLRDTTLKLRQSGLSDQTLEVEEGSYYVSTRTPDGDEQVLAGPIEVSAGASLNLDLSVEPEAALDLGRRSAATATMDSTETVATVPAPTIEAALWRDGCWISWWIGRAGQREVRVPLPNTSSYALDTAHLIEAPKDRTAHAQPSGNADLLLAVDEGRQGEMTFFAVPFDGPVGEPHLRPTSVTIRRRAVTSANRRPESPELAFAFEDPEVTQLLEFVREGFARESRAYSQMAVEAARTELLYKEASPLGAVIGMYVLLRANALEELDIATSNLMKIAPGLPDVLPLRVEYLARTARHDEAIAELQRARTFGCPWFCSGVTYLLSRARSYLGPGSLARGDLTAPARAEIGQVASGLELLSAYLDPNRTVATYRDVPVEN